MKKTVRILNIAMLCVICALSLVSCSGGIKRDEAKAFISEFLEAVESGDFEKAGTYQHPERGADLESFFLSIEEAEGIDFQAGIEIEKYTNFSSALYDTTVGGSTYELTMRTKVGDNTVKFMIELVKNEHGYGIYNLDIDT